MIVTLYNTEITIADENRFEHVKMAENYEAMRQSYSGSGVKYLTIDDSNTVIDITSKNICIIDKRTNKD